jgi:hypothetical protein
MKLKEDFTHKHKKKNKKNDEKIQFRGKEKNL